MTPFHFGVDDCSLASLYSKLGVDREKLQQIRERAYEVQAQLPLKQYNCFIAIRQEFKRLVKLCFSLSL